VHTGEQYAQYMHRSLTVHPMSDSPGCQNDLTSFDTLTPPTSIMEPSSEDNSLTTLKPSNVNVDGNNNELFKTSLKAPAEASNNLKPTSKSRASRGSQASVLPPMLKNGNLCDVVLCMATSSATGEEIFLANSLAGVELAKLPVPMLCMLCAQWNLKKYRSARKDEILALIATHQKMPELY
jgi:hypothetical protein